MTTIAESKTKRMTWEEKWALILTIAIGATVRMRKPGDWYVSASMEHAHGMCMLVSNYGNGISPRAAVEDHWRKYTDGRPFFVNDKWHVWTGTQWAETKDPRA